MKTIRITGSDNKVTRNFLNREFFIRKIEYDCPVCLIQAAQILRDWISDEMKKDTPVRITSTLRPESIGSAHEIGHAVDFVCDSANNEFLKKFKAEVMKYLDGEKSDLIQNLRMVGVTRFGIENVCVHLDYDFGSRPHTDNYGKYGAFRYIRDERGNVIENRSI